MGSVKKTAVKTFWFWLKF